MTRSDPQGFRALALRNRAAILTLPGRAVRIQRHERGPRVYVAGQRVHHGPAFGMAAILCWRNRWRLVAAALGAVAATDYRDFPFRDCDNH